MTFTPRSAAIVSALMLLIAVATQIFYITVVSPAGPDTVLRPITWLVETASFSVLAVAALVLTARGEDYPLAWGAIAIGSLFNILQAGMGLSMFGPAMDASETVPELFGAILAGAFFFYFLAKAFYAMAAIGLGRAVLRMGGPLGAILGSAVTLAGAVAFVLNAMAMAAGKEWTYAAGASGTAATALLALAILALRGAADRASVSN